jgi:hypothetical protein
MGELGVGSRQLRAPGRLSRISASRSATPERFCTLAHFLRFPLLLEGRRRMLNASLGRDHNRILIPESSEVRS